MLKRVWMIAISAAAFIAVKPTAAQRPLLPNMYPFRDSAGVVQTYSTAGDVDLTGPFFQSLGTNGRACVSCHQPDQGWTVSAHPAPFARIDSQDLVFDNPAVPHKYFGSLYLKKESKTEKTDRRQTA